MAAEPPEPENNNTHIHPNPWYRLRKFLEGVEDVAHSVAGELFQLRPLLPPIPALLQWVDTRIEDLTLLEVRAQEYAALVVALETQGGAAHLDDAEQAG